MSERFFSDQPILTPQITLAGDEFRHLASVMRAEIGDEVTLFDGSGAEFTARIVRLGKRDAELEVVQRLEISRELPFSLTLAVALPKGDRQKWLVEKLTELGVTRLVPLITERGVAEPGAGAIERLKRGVIEASKQCGRNRLLEIAPPAAACPYFQTATLSARRLIAEASGSEHAGAICGETIAAIGPEGGFSPAELRAARDAQWLAVSLGARILRVETAAIACAATIAQAATISLPPAAA